MPLKSIWDHIVDAATRAADQARSAQNPAPTPDTVPQTQPEPDPPHPTIVVPVVPTSSGFATVDDEKHFFDYVREHVFGGRLTEGQVGGMKAKIVAYSAASWSISWAAYGFATSCWETARTMQPIREHGGPAYFTRMYDITGQRPQVAKRLGNLKPGDGARFPGRGDVQLTGRSNYEKATRKLREKGIVGPEIDLVENPDLALRSDISAAIMVCGMEEGWFTGRKMLDYLPKRDPASFEQFKQARRIINGTDRWAEIANLAVQFQKALEAGRWRK